jgi:SAM-dependent methyltransferase
MQKATYEIEAQVEADHWWFKGRRRLLIEIIRRLGVLPAEPVLDVGTGTGANLSLLNRLAFSDIFGIDNNLQAIHFCGKRGIGSLIMGDICDLPFQGDTFGLALVTDVLEHIDDDEKALSEITRVLLPNGFLIITVPAFRGLWGLQDKVACHKRRYTLQRIKAMVEEANLRTERIFYFNYILLFPIWFARKVIDLFKIELQSENQVNTKIVNSILWAVFSLDIRTCLAVSPPFGVSMLVAAMKSPREA